jgi:hypothetical protein
VCVCVRVCVFVCALHHLIRDGALLRWRWVG